MLGQPGMEGPGNGELGSSSFLRRSPNISHHAHPSRYHTLPTRKTPGLPYRQPGFSTRPSPEHHPEKTLPLGNKCGSYAPACNIPPHNRLRAFTHYPPPTCGAKNQQNPHNRNAATHNKKTAKKQVMPYKKKTYTRQPQNNHLQPRRWYRFCCLTPQRRASPG